MLPMGFPRATRLAVAHGQCICDGALTEVSRARTRINPSIIFTVTSVIINIEVGGVVI